MTTEELNKLFEKKNLTELLSYTLLGLSIVKERFKEYKDDSGCYGYKQLEGVNDAEELVKKYLFEVISYNKSKIMKVKIAGKLYDVVEIKKSLGITHYCIEDEPNHYDWVNNVEVIEDDGIKEGGEE